MIDPVHIMKYPLKSRKSGESHQTGQYGRGLQGFRGFANTLTYITLRSEVNQSEWDHPISRERLEKAKKHGIDGTCLRLSLSKENIWETKLQGKTRRTFKELNPTSKIIQTAVQTVYEPIKTDEFKKFSNTNTGTIVIFSNWLDDEFEEFIKDPKKIFERVNQDYNIPNKKVRLIKRASHILAGIVFEQPFKNGELVHIGCFKKLMQIKHINDRINPQSELICHLDIGLSIQTLPICRERVKNNPGGIRNHLIEKHQWHSIPDLEFEKLNSKERKEKIAYYNENPYLWFSDNQLFWKEFRNSQFLKPTGKAFPRPRD